MCRLTLLSLLAACQGPAVQETGDTAPPPTADLSGVALDPVAGYAPVAGASVLVETPSGHLSATTGKDGRFTVSGVLSQEPIAVTAFQRERTARTYQLPALEGQSQPLVFWMPRRDLGDYPTTDLQVAAQVQGQPAGCRVCFYWSGPGGEYCVDSPGNDPLTVPFTARFLQEATSYGISALAIDPSTEAPISGAAFTTSAGGPVQVRLLEDPVRTLVVRTDQPEVGNDPLSSFDPYHQHEAALVHVGEYRQLGGSIALTGRSTEVLVLVDGLEMTVPYVPASGAQNRVELTLSRTFGTGHFAWTDLPLVPGNPFEVDLLDGPEIDKEAFVPGAVLEWDDIPEAEDFQLRVVEGDEVAWELHTREPTLAFPAFPEGFDTAQIFADGTWDLRSRARDDGEWGWNGTDLDPMGSYRATVTRGGRAAWE